MKGQPHEIDNAKWEWVGEYPIEKHLRLTVHDREGRPVKCYMSLRQPYCDRGHIQLHIDGPIYLDGADGFPRFFFSRKECDEHTRLFLKWRLWKIRLHPHTLEEGKTINDHFDRGGVEL